MVRAGHQSWARGDLLALDFADEDDEAAWICDRIEAMRGLAFDDTADGGAAGPVVVGLRRAVPVGREGRRTRSSRRCAGATSRTSSRASTGSSTARRSQAVVGVFRYMAGLVEAPIYELSGEDANLLPASGDWAAALARPGRGSRLRPRRAVGRLQHPAPLPRVPRGARRSARRRFRATRCARELVFYQLGKFSQAISDFEEIYFNTEPAQKYESFANWLEYQAPDYYAESDADVGYATPDAVTLTTVHQAKGMQWPAVFVPCLRKNRFPSKRHGGLGLFHVIPDAAIADADRYRGTVEDETRLFYVAVTRAQKYLFVSFSPGANQLYKKRSDFFDHCASQQWFSTRDTGVPADAPRLEPQARHETPERHALVLGAEVPVRVPVPVQAALPLRLQPAAARGARLREGPARRAVGGAQARARRRHRWRTTRPRISSTGTCTLRTRTPRCGRRCTTRPSKSVERYLDEHGSTLERTVHSEKQIQVHVAPGITVDGRIDLVRRLDTDELAIVDFKSTARAQDEDVTRDQLHVYAVGYEELTGERADLIEVLNLDEEGKTIREEVEEPLLVGVRVADPRRGRLAAGQQPSAPGRMGRAVQQVRPRRVVSRRPCIGQGGATRGFRPLRPLLRWRGWDPEHLVHPPRQPRSSATSARRPRPQDVFQLRSGQTIDLS